MNRILPVFLSLMLCLTATAQKNETGTGENPVSRREAADPVIMKLYGASGPYAKYDPARELPEKRTETAKHFRNEDGTETALLTAGPMHYFENGEWLTSSNEIIPVQMPLYPGYVLMNRHNRYKTLYGTAGKGIAIKKADGSDLLSGYTQEGIFLYDLDKKMQKNVLQYNKEALPVQSAETDNHIEYGLTPDISLQVTQLTGKIKSQYFIRSNPFAAYGSSKYLGFAEQLSFAEPVEIVSDEQKKGLLVKNADGEVLFSYNEAYYFQQNRKSSSEYEEAEYLVTKVNDLTYKIVLLVPIDWFNNPERVYPVIVDPSVTCTPNASIYWTGTTNEDADAHSSDNIKVGFYDCSGCDDETWAPYAKINLSSIPDGSCIQNASFSMYQHTWRNGGGDDGLRFEIGWANVEPVSASWASIRDNVQGLSERYARWDVWGTPGNCSGCNGGYDYPESPNGWKNFNIDYALHRNRVANRLGTDYITYGLDMIYNASDCFWCWGDETNELEYYGWSNGSRPQLSVTYQSASVAPTGISGTTSICSGGSTTLTVSGGSVGSDATIQWFSGSCGSTVIGTGNSITVSPASSTTYFVRYSGSCNTTGCASVTVTVNSASVAPTGISGTTIICNGNSTTLTLSGGSAGTGATAQWFSGSCGSTVIGTGNSITVSPTSNTTYFVRYSGSCNTTGCASVMVTVNTLSVAPASVSGTTAVCAGGSTTLTLSGGSAGTGATAQWFSGSCGSTVIGTGNSVIVSPGANTTYFVRYSGTCNTTACVSATVTVNPAPAAFTPLISTSTPLCYRGNAEITIASSQAGVSYQLRDNTTNVGPAQPGTGGTLPFRTGNLTANSTTHNVLATDGAGCTLSVNVPTISVTAAATTLANNNDTRTCYVNANNAFVEFVTSGRSIIAVDPGTQNLGQVTVTEYVDGTPVNIQACNTNSVTQPEFNSAALSRHWVITSTNPPVTPVNVRLYLADGDVTSLAATANFNVNPDDDVSGIGSLELSRYSGPNENATFSDNCNTGGNTYLHTQGGNGTVTAGISGNAIAGASYVTYTVNGFSEWWLSGTGATGPLPVVLGSFDAECAKGGVEIRWTTVSEVNNAYFTIERSADATHWELLHEVSGAGNSNTPLNYSITDDRPLNGIAYYRLRQTDHNGDNETFAPQSVTCFGNAQNGLLIYPNPSNDYFVLNFSAAADMEGSVELMDMTGRRVAVQNGSWQSGTNSFTFKDLAAFLPGTYTLRISGDGKVLYTAPVIIKR